MFFSQQSAEASDCDKFYLDKNYEKAITACAFEVSKGNQQFQITLGKAYKRANQIVQAQEVFAKCKDQYFECMHENAFFLENVDQARKDWKAAYENGVSNSSWALAVSYNKSGDIATANLWIDKAVAANNPVGKLMKSARLLADKDYEASLEIAKSLIGADLSDYPSNGPIGFTVEKYILDIYEEIKDEKLNERNFVYEHGIYAGSPKSDYKDYYESVLIKLYDSPQFNAILDFMKSNNIPYQYNLNNWEDYNSFKIPEHYNSYYWSKIISYSNVYSFDLICLNYARIKLLIANKEKVDNSKRELFNSIMKKYSLNAEDKGYEEYLAWDANKACHLGSINRYKKMSIYAVMMS
jgi:hypothetical protein